MASPSSLAPETPLMGSPSPVGSPAPEDDSKKDKKKDKKEEKKEKKAAKREAERLEGLRRAEERKKRREALSTPKTPMSVDLDDDDGVEAVTDALRPAKKM